MSLGWIIWYAACATFGVFLAMYGNRESFTRFKWWLLWKLDPWYEERASLDLAWRVFARKHNTSGKLPICAYKGWEKDLDPDAKAAVYEFPGGDPDALPNCLNESRDPADVVGLLDSALRDDHAIALKEAFADRRKVEGTDDGGV